jgi:hypothetical protein
MRLCRWRITERLAGTAKFYSEYNSGYSDIPFRHLIPSANCSIYITTSALTMSQITSLTASPCRLNLIHKELFTQCFHPSSNNSPHDLRSSHHHLPPLLRLSDYRSRLRSALHPHYSTGLLYNNSNSVSIYPLSQSKCLFQTSTPAFARPLHPLEKR